MQDSNILLSISLLVSGRKETKKCLDSLLPLLEAVPSELLLTDTGCDPNTRELIEQYTDKIYNFEWCKDFAKARNIGVSHASGKWFLYLDDDEWFTDTSEIIEFFTSGEYKKYASARYYQRNYVNREGTRYVDNVVLRMVQMEENTCFHGMIHEYLTPVQNPIKDFATWVDHYGYIFASKEEEYKHVERNASLLWQEIELEPYDMRWYAQLAQEYIGIKEYEKVLEVCQKALEVYNTMRPEQMIQGRLVGAIYGYIVRSYEQKYDSNQALFWIDEGVESEKITESAKAFLYQVKMTVEYREGNYEQCVDAFEKYMRIYDDKGNDLQAIAEETSLINNGVFQEVPRMSTILRGLTAAAKSKNKRVLLKFFYELDWNDKRLFNQDDLENAILQYAVDTMDADVIRCVKCFGEREYGMLELAPVANRLESDLEIKGKYDDLAALQTIISEIESDHQYVTICKIIVSDAKHDVDGIKRLFNNIFDKSEVMLKANPKIWDISHASDIDFVNLFKKVNLNDWRRSVEAWSNQVELKDMETWLMRLEEWGVQDDVRYTLLKRCLLKYRLLRTNWEVENIGELEKAFEEFANFEMKYCLRLYQREIFEQIPELLPEECQLAFLLDEVLRVRKNGTDKECVSILKRMMGVCTKLYPVVGIYVKKINQEIQKQNAEMQEIANQLKEHVTDFINAGQLDNARMVLNQLQGYFPDDVEVKEMMNLLG